MLPLLGKVGIPREGVSSRNPSGLSLQDKSSQLKSIIRNMLLKHSANYRRLRKRRGEPQLPNEPQAIQVFAAFLIVTGSSTHHQNKVPDSKLTFPPDQVKARLLTHVLEHSSISESRLSVLVCSWK